VVLVIDDSRDRKDGTATAHVGRQWVGRLGKADNGIVTDPEGGADILQAPTALLAQGITHRPLLAHPPRSP